MAGIVEEADGVLSCRAQVRGKLCDGKIDVRLRGIAQHVDVPGREARPDQAEAHVLHVLMRQAERSDGGRIVFVPDQQGIAGFRRCGERQPGQNPRNNQCAKHDPTFLSASGRA
jgi:hypothetical protein